MFKTFQGNSVFCSYSEILAKSLHSVCELKILFNDMDPAKIMFIRNVFFIRNTWRFLENSEIRILIAKGTGHTTLSAAFFYYMQLLVLALCTNLEPVANGTEKFLQSESCCFSL